MKLDFKGLTSSEAKERLKQYGFNLLPEKPPPSDFSIMVDQLKSPLVYILILASIITLLLGHISDTVIIAVAIVLNSVLGFVQERKAHNALQALKKLITSQTEVVRDGNIIKIKTEEVVPGDIVVLRQGTKIPADGFITESNRFFVDEAMLTGESRPVEKTERGDKDDLKRMVYMGTIVVAGMAVMEVVQTGSNTQIGKIALEIQDESEDTPLKRQLSHFSSQLVWVISGLTVFVFVVGLLTSRGVREMLSTSVALAVSAIPEGLLVGLTVVLAIGMQRILKRKGLVRRLASAETLGGVTTICVDKTGTLTKGQMQVVEVFGDSADIARQMVLANDLDDPIVISAHKWAIEKLNIGQAKIKKLLEKYSRVDSIPFSSKDRFFASLNLSDGESNQLYVNGAPDYILRWTNLSEKERSVILAHIEQLTSEGKRLVGLGMKKMPTKTSVIKETDVKKGLQWVGLIAFNDPVREGVSESLAQAVRSGITIKVITGDYSKTAVSVMKSLGMSVTDEEVLTGDDLRSLSDHELSQRIDKVKLFARTTPEQKLKIVKLLKSKGEIVAMMGDGVNDAPALNQADIGIVVGEATDVARESADLILLDSHFDTVIAAVEEGRGIFENIRKVLIYLMGSAFNGITAVLGAMIIGIFWTIPLPVTAAQILWINLVTDGFPDLALTVDPKRSGIMDEMPRNSKEPLVSGWMKVLIGIVSITSGLLALGLFVYTYWSTSDVAISQSVAFLSLGLNSLFYVFSVRTLKQPFWVDGMFANKYLLYAVFIGFVLQIVPFATNTTRSFFGVGIIPFEYVFLVVMGSVFTVLIIEVIKIFFRRALD